MLHKSLHSLLAGPFSGASAFPYHLLHLLFHGIPRLGSPLIDAAVCNLQRATHLLGIGRGWGWRGRGGCCPESRTLAPALCSSTFLGSQGSQNPSQSCHHPEKFNELWTSLTLQFWKKEGGYSLGNWHLEKLLSF